MGSRSCFGRRSPQPQALPPCPALLCARPPAAARAAEARAGWRAGVVKIADMGLAKRLADADGPASGNHSFHTSAAGTLGWRAPEQVRGERCGKAVRAPPPPPTILPTVPPTVASPTKHPQVDLFAAGCIFFFVLTRGRHPFGPHAVREANIAAGAADLSALEPAPGGAGPDPDEPAPLRLAEAADLVRRLIAPDPTARPPAASARRHLCLFSARRRLDFLSAVSDRLCLEPHPHAAPADAAAARAATDALAAAVEALAPHVLPPPRGGGGGGAAARGVGRRAGRAAARGPRKRSRAAIPLFAGARLAPRDPQQGRAPRPGSAGGPAPPRGPTRRRRGARGRA